MRTHARRPVRNRLATLALVSWWTCAAATGCGGEVEDRVPSISTSLDRSRSLGSLDVEEAASFCQSLERGMRDALPRESVLEWTCIHAAYDVDDDPVDCETGFRTCMENPASVPEVGVLGGCSAFAQQVARCDITLDEIAQCYDAVLEATSPTFRTTTDCRTVTSEEALLERDVGMRRRLDPFAYEACDALALRCPRLLYLIVQEP